MKNPPLFFESIRQGAAKRWDQLEQDPELAGPWHQLFKQVQSPRHIVSELLQNADDAGATEAVVRIEGTTFVFEHNGVDFEAEHFASLCRFGYSNKRALHTIGFRGIGFKSTFSLGDLVQLFTPSLSVGFHIRRFSEPIWLDSHIKTEGLTRIQVEISDHHRQREVEKNLEEWFKSPTSLLFFKNIRRMQVGDREVHWTSAGNGPVPGSEWMKLGIDEKHSFLHIQSEAEAFPDDALVEIRQERMLGNDDAADFPPCRVEIVLGAKGRLYVVLPTGVETGLPFACNAPFIQDPARLKIKDPEISPTNRWLLERAGILAASAMCHWLEQTDTALNVRADAYDLLPRAPQGLESLDGLCSSITNQAFTQYVDDKKLLLTQDANLVSPKQCINVPSVVLDVWTAAQVLHLLDPSNRPLLCQSIKPANRAKLLQLGWISDIDKEKLLEILRQQSLPTPDSWMQLLRLWAYVASEITGYRNRGDDIKIMPVQGHDILFAAKDVIRLGDKMQLQSEIDWEFLAHYLTVLNQGWTKYLSEQAKELTVNEDLTIRKSLGVASAVLAENGLQNDSEASKVIDQVATNFFSSDGIRIDACVQIAQISAKLGANVGQQFHFVTRDRKLKPFGKSILIDEDGLLEEFLAPGLRDALLLHPDYSSSFKSCSHEEWQKWLANNRSGLRTFIPLVQKRIDIYGKPAIEAEAHSRDLSVKLNYHYVTHQFQVEDWDFDEVYWIHWQTLAADDAMFWAKLVERVLKQDKTFWSNAMTARFLHVASTGSTKPMTFDPATPAWVKRLRELPCLLDTRGFPRKPAELLRRAPETESLIDVELFIHGRLDREVTRPLLDLLGVRSTPTGPDRLLNCLQALATSKTPPVHEVEKWYRRLDQMLDSCSTDAFQKVRQAFQSEKLILTQDGVWADSHSVFIFSDEEDVPDAAVISASVRDLALWRKIGVAERPNIDLAIAWLNSLQSGSLLSPDEVRRVRGLLSRHPLRIWDECKHWINLAGEWVPVGELTYALTMSSLTAWSHLHQWVKKRTADMQRVPDELTVHPPFSTLSLLSAQLEQRLKQLPLSLNNAVQKDWLKTLATELCRVELNTDDETARVRSMALAISKAKWLELPGLEVIPYIGSMPAGTAKRADVVWSEDILYVDSLSKAKLARKVPEEIGKFFNRSDIKSALDYSFERSTDDVREYLEENFSLAAIPAVAVEPTKANKTLTDATVINVSQKPSQDQSVEQVNPGANPVQESPIIEIEEKPALETPVKPEPADENTHPHHPPKIAKQPLIERFALAKGFVKHGDDRYLHPSGRWIGRTTGSRFPWGSHTASGDLILYYFPKEHCLQLEPLQLDAEVWGLIDKKPETSSLILLDAQDEPVEMTGAHLRELCDKGQVTLYPATYRLVYDHDHHQ